MRQIRENLWVHEDRMMLGPVILPLRMTVVSLTNGGLFVHSPTALTQELKASISALGTVTAVVAPNNSHHLWLQEWQAAYPQAHLQVSRGIPKKIPGLSGYELLSDQANPLWQEDLDHQLLHGVPFFDECVFLHKASRSLIVTDLVQDHRGQEQKGLGRIMTKLILQPIGFKGICSAPPLRFPFTIKDRSAFAEGIKVVQRWNFERIIVTHGDIIEEDAKAVFERLIRRFTMSP